MSRLLVAFTVAIGASISASACSSPNDGPTSPSAVPGSQDVTSTGSSPASSVPSAVPPRFNVQAILRGDGFGLVEVRQEKDPTQNILYFDVWVRDLLPNTSYGLQRAVDVPQDGVCTGTNWSTLGQGTTPQPFVTDERGTGRAALWRATPLTVSPSDIHFRVIQTGTTNVPLQSDCFKLFPRD